MKRFVLSAFSLVLAVSAVAAPSAQAFPKGDPAFKLQTLRLREFDARNKSEEAQQPDYGYTQAPEWDRPEAVTIDEESVVESEAIAPQPTETAAEENTSANSITERRQQALDRS